MAVLTEQSIPANVRDAELTHDTWLVQASGLRKKYCRDLRKSLFYSLRDVLDVVSLRRNNPAELREHEFWAVDDVSFELRRGDSLALLGRNGAGKSTLLKLITGQRSLTSGTVTTRGRIVALTELGLGFDPVLTGRENAYVNAAVHGVSRRAFDKLIEEIIDFSELREFIDSAVQTYSTGMKARLGFSIATHLKPDILIVDEVLAVGDLEFRRKCVQHVLAYLQNGGSIILVAHDPYLVQSICNRALVLDQGRVVFSGSGVEGVDFHFRLGHANQYAVAAKSPDTASQDAAEHDGTEDSIQSPKADIGQPGSLPKLQFAKLELIPTRPVVIDQLEILPVDGEALHTGQPAKVVMRYRSSIHARVVWAFTLCTADLHVAIASCTRGMDGEDSSISPGEHSLVCRLPELLLRPGVYAIRGGIGDAISHVGLAVTGYEDAPTFFTVVERRVSRANNWQLMQNDLVVMKAEWF